MNIKGTYTHPTNSVRKILKKICSLADTTIYICADFPYIYNIILLSIPLVDSTVLYCKDLNYVALVFH